MMNMRPRTRDIRIGLQVKAILALSFLVLAVAIVGGMAYWHLVSQWMQSARLAGVNSEFIDAHRRLAHRQIILTAAAIVLAALPVGWLLVWRVIVRPLRRLMTATGELATGNFAARVRTPCNDELGLLAQSFNAMAEQLDVQRRQLLDHNGQLEQEVRQRTGELRRTNERLRAEMADKEEFLRAVSHDLNAPLRNIAGMATMVMMKYGAVLPEEVVARLQRIQANVDVQSELLTELLELSRLRSRPEKREPVDMTELVAGVFGMLEDDLRRTGICATAAPGMPMLHVDRTRMRQVFQNLIDNAVKYMPPDRADGRVEVTYRRQDGEHVFTVRDNGAGIAPEDQQRIFQVFRRASSASAGRVPGKGVGLASVRTILGNYDGRVWVESQPGQGAAFHVALPESATRPSAPVTPAAAGALPPAETTRPHGRADYDPVGRR